MNACEFLAPHSYLISKCYNTLVNTELSGNVYLVRGGAEMVEPILFSIKNMGIDVYGNPDIYTREYLQFGIEDARGLGPRASSRAVKEKGRIFIIVTFGMTSEGQNALLKILEEPLADAVFYFVVSSPETLLPTLRSRVQILRLSQEFAQKGIVDANEFLRAAKTKRIEMLKGLLPKEKEVRDTGAIIAFLSSLERSLAKLGTRKSKEGLEAVYLARKYVADKGSILKTLLEQVALLV